MAVLAHRFYVKIVVGRRRSTTLLPPKRPASDLGDEGYRDYPFISVKSGSPDPTESHGALDRMGLLSPLVSTWEVRPRG